LGIVTEAAGEGESEFEIDAPVLVFPLDEVAILVFGVGVTTGVDDFDSRTEMDEERKAEEEPDFTVEATLTMLDVVGIFGVVEEETEIAGVLDLITVTLTEGDDKETATPRAELVTRTDDGVWRLAEEALMLVDFAGKELKGVEVELIIATLTVLDIEAALFVDGTTEEALFVDETTEEAFVVLPLATPLLTGLQNAAGV